MKTNCYTPAPGEPEPRTKISNNRESGITSNVNELHTQLFVLNELLEDLSNKVSVVSFTAEPTCEKEASPCYTRSSPVAARIAEDLEYFARLNETLKNIIDNIDL